MERFVTERKEIPVDPSAEKYKDLGNEKYKEGKYEEAIQFYTKAIEIDGKRNASYLGNRAACYIMLKNFEPALEDSLLATNIQPDFVKGYLRAANCYLQLGKVQQAITQYQQALIYDPKNTTGLTELQSAKRAWNLLGQIRKEMESLGEQQQQAHREEQHWKSVLAQIESAISLCPFSDELKLMKAKVLLALKKYNDALALSSNILRHDNTNMDAIYVRSESIFLSGNLSGAIRQLRQGLELDPDNAACRKLIKRIQLLETKKMEGNEAFSSGYVEKAYDIYTEALSIEPRCDALNSIIFCNRAATLMKLKKWSEALNDCNQTIALDPKNLKAYLRRASCHTNLAEYEEAGKLPRLWLTTLLPVGYALKTFKHAPIHSSIHPSIHPSILSSPLSIYLLIRLAHKASGHILSHFYYVCKWIVCNLVRDYEKAVQMDPDNMDLKRSLNEAKLTLKRSKRKDYYKILDISKDADDSQIKAAYKRQALRWHPDKNSESEESRKQAEKVFKDVGEAYAVLSDPQKRRRFDAGEDLEDLESGGMENVDINQIFQTFFGGGPFAGQSGFGNGGGPFGSTRGFHQTRSRSRPGPFHFYEGF